VKRILLFIAVLLHIVCGADHKVTVLSQQALDAIISDTGGEFNHCNDKFTHTIYVPNPVTFSTQHRHFRHHPSAPYYDLDHMSTEQLVRYFSSREYTEEDILSHPMLYMNQAYLAITKQLPRYPEFVEKYHKKYRQYKGFYKFWEKINFRYRSGMKKQFARLYRECREQAYLTQKTRERKNHEEYARKQKEHAVYCAELEALSHDDHMHDAVPYQHQQARKSACAQIKASMPDHTMRKYTMTQDTVTFAHGYAITEHNLASLQGNAYEQQLHIEFLEQLTEAHTISTSYALQPKNILIDAIGHGAAIGMEANRLQQPNVATTWANLGWKVLDIMEGIGEGLVLFAENTADMILHPRHTLKQMIHGLGMVTGFVARTCARAMGTASYWHELMEHGDGLLMAQEMDQVAHKVSTFGAYCTEKAAALETRDIAKYGTAIAADMLLTHKMFLFGGTFCTRATPVIRDAMAHVSVRATAMGKSITNALEAARTESPALQTAEGMLMKASEELNKIGSAAVNIIKDARLALEAIHAEYMAGLKIELETLRLMYDNKIKGAAELANKWLKIEYEHILGMEFYFSRRGTLKIGGFHHDFMQTIEKSNLFEFTEKVMHKTGFYKAKLYFKGDPVKEISFFPSEWPRQKVIEKIHEAYGNFVKSGAPLELQNDGKYLVKGIIEENITIEMYITAKGKIVTAYPKI
jgi:hypothetical protein